MSAQNSPKIDYTTRWDGGISDLSKNAPDTQYGFGRSVNYRTDPYKLTILPQTVKESGFTITDLVKDGDRIGSDLYEYGDTGNIYKRTTAGSVTKLRTVANSHGNGMKYYGEDDYLYYTSDKVIGRYGQVVNGTPVFSDDFMGAQGGVPQNTQWLDLESSSSQYASKADNASLSITSDLTLEGWIRPESLPVVGSSMVIASKWNEQTNQRSYKFDIYAVSGYFGDGSNGALTVSANTTDVPIDSACSGTVATRTLSATNASFASGQIILVHQSQGSGAGTWQRNKISGYTAGTITLEDPLNATYVTGAQVLVVKQYSSVTINNGITWTAKAWDGSTGGILAFLCNGSFTNNGTVSAYACGFRGGDGSGVSSRQGRQGEGVSGFGTASQSANSTGGGGGTPDTAAGDGGGGGGGGSHSTAGTTGTSKNNGQPGVAATGIVGTADLTTMVFGGGGGEAGSDDGGSNDRGGNGGGIVWAIAATWDNEGIITINGENGVRIGSGQSGGAGAGAAGSMLGKGQTILNNGVITALGGTGTPYGTGGASSIGGNGGLGRVHFDYLTSAILNGTISPVGTSGQDNTLVTTTTYQLRFCVSSNGTNEEFLTKNTNLVAAQLNHVAVSWDASASTANFMIDGSSIGTSTGAFTAIFNSTAAFAVGADFSSAGAARNFYDGRIDEVRLWNTERTAAQVYGNKESYISIASTGLVSWWKFNNDYVDATSSANDLTSSGSPTFATDVPFSASSTRQDLDQELNTSGNTYTLPSSINEAATHRQTFVPNRDPQKSIEVLVAGKGTGSWTVTVHDPQNRIIATATITNANMHTGDMEFTFTSVWRPVRGATYHFHITSSDGTGTVTTTTASDLETVDFHTYFQFLVEDQDYHQIEQILNLLAIGNERYVATYAADTGYDPHRLVFPSGWRVRCFALWRGYLAIGCTRGNEITDTDEGMIFFWDGKSTTYNDFVPIPEGGINAMKTYKGKLFIAAGYRGEILVYEGGDSTNDDLKKRIPKMGDDEYIEIMPKGMTVWDGMLRIGVAGRSDAGQVERGVYTYGRRLAVSPVSLSYDYPISTGTRNSASVNIGFLYPIDTKLIVGWKDNVSFGHDVVDQTALPFGTAEVVKDIKDFGRVSKEKAAMVVRAEFDPLRTTGETVDFDIPDFLLNNLTYIGVDTMKLNKDLVRVQLTDEQIAAYVAPLAEMNITHISISPPMDETADYLAEGVDLPMPRTAANHTKAWFDAIHAAGKKVIYRGTFNGIEGIYDFQHKVGASRFPAGTAASAAADGQTTWLGKIDDWIRNHADFWQNGDIFAPIPEATGGGIFSDGTSFLSYGGSGIQTNYENFFKDIHTVANAAFTAIGKSGVITGLSSNNYSEANSGWINGGLFSDAGVVAVDHYGTTHTVEEMESDLRGLSTAKGLPIFLQEWSDYWNGDLDEDSRIAYLKTFYSLFNELITDGVLTGFNYWGGWVGGEGEGILESDGAGGYQLNVYGQLLKASLSQVAPMDGEFIRLKYRFDRSSEWTYGEYVTADGTTEARLNINKGNHRELEYAAEMGTTVATSPALLELGVQEDLKLTEERY
jgi:hypothetical protein